MSVLRLKPADDGCFFYHRTADPRCAFHDTPPPKETEHDDGIAGAIVNRDSAGDTDVASESESEAMR